MDDTRLIERWLPIAALGIESTRERTPMTPFPAPNRLHVWWARRPLVASRAAVLASLLPADADRERFVHVLGIHGDPVETRRRLDKAKRENKKLGSNPYGYKRAFSYTPTEDESQWIASILPTALHNPTILDPTAGGGSIPLEADRLGFMALANDLNPVAALILRATTEWPRTHGTDLSAEFDHLANRFIQRAEPRYVGIFPAEPDGARVEGYLWARTVACPYCGGVIPLSPNWRLASDGTGVRLLPGGTGGNGDRVCGFEIVGTEAEQSRGTVAGGSAVCPFPECGRVIPGDEIKQQAQAGGMAEQLYAVAVKRRSDSATKTGKSPWETEVRYRAPRPEDCNFSDIAARLAEKLPEWEAFDLVPSEHFPETGNDTRPIQYGMPLWRDLFSPRQLFCHGTAVEVFRELLEADRAAGALTETRRAAYAYLAFSLDKLLNYNSRLTRWIVKRAVVTGTFDRHDFSFVWSYAEMAPLIAGFGFDWAIGETAKCIQELVALTRSDASASDRGLFPSPGKAPGNAGLQTGTASAASGNRATSPDPTAPPPVTITCKSADALDHLDDASVDVVVMDPPYYDNVMYAELSDFFYVWLKRTAGHVVPDLFRRRLTDKDNEAVANPARFAGQKHAKARAAEDYRQRMALIFAECRRVLRPDGVMTLMFTHKTTAAWDALTAGLIEAGFEIRASWPILTEAPGSLHIKNRAAANSTVFLVCRPRPAAAPEEDEDRFWEDVEPTVADAVRDRVEAFQDAGIAGVDLYLACFGPALEEFSRHWPLRRGRPRVRPAKQRGTRKQELFGAPWDPYAVTPEDALDVARREVKRWRLRELTKMTTEEDLDPPTAFFVLAWDTFRAPAFAYDEALRLARAAGVDLDRQIVGRFAEKKASDLQLWDSERRAAAGSLGPPDGSRGMLDALHHAAHRARQGTLEEAKQALEAVGLLRERRFLLALRAVLEVLPPSSEFTGAELPRAAAGAGSDFEALEQLRRFAFHGRAEEPRQLRLFQGTEG